MTRQSRKRFKFIVLICLMLTFSLFLCVSVVFAAVREKVKSPLKIEYDPGMVITRQAGYYTADGEFTSWDDLIEEGYISGSEFEVDGGAFDVEGELIIPEGIVTIAPQTFVDCYFTSVKIPSTVEVISDSAFANCVNLVSVEFSENSQLMEIAPYAFSLCSSLTSVVIPETVKSIGDHAFQNTNLKDAEFENVYGWYAYNFSTGDGREMDYSILSNTSNAATLLKSNYRWECSSAANVAGLYNGGSLSSSWGELLSSEMIGVSESLLLAVDISISGEFIIHKSITSLISNVFYGAESLISVVIPESVTSIGSYAFFECSSLTSVEFENPYGWSAGSTELSSADLSNTSTAATYLKTTYASYEWTCSKSMKAAGLYDEDGNLTSTWDELVANGTITVSGTTITDCSTSISGELIIPDYITNIGEQSFAECLDLKKVIIGAGVTDIHKHAFYSCQNMESVVISNSVNNIEMGAFCECNNLKIVYIDSQAVMNFSTWSSNIFNYTEYVYVKEDVTVTSSYFTEIDSDVDGYNKYTETYRVIEKPPMVMNPN